VFKNLFIYEIMSAIPAHTAMETSLDAMRFTDLGKSQEKSVGWVEPRGQAHGPLVEAIAGHYIMRLMVETKSVPGSVVRREADVRAKLINEQTGRKPGKKEMREIKEDVKMALLPSAFPKEAAHWVWIDPKAKLLMIDAASQSKSDEVITMLIKSMDGLELGRVQSEKSPQTVMSQWLIEQDPPQNFSVDRECELKTHDDSKASVKFSKHNLDRDDVRKHIEEGKLPTRLAVTWNDRVSFSLTDNLQLKKITILDVAFEQTDEDADSFDATVAITTGELSKAIPDLFAALA
jgi:recombination associated protein RdgC